MGHNSLKEIYVNVDELRERKSCIRDWSEPRMHEIIKAVATEFHVTPAEITSRKKTEVVAHARQAVYLLAIIMTGHSTQSIAAFCGARDHSSVLWGIMMMHKRRQECPSLAHRLACARALSFEYAAKRVEATRISPEEIAAMTKPGKAKKDGRRHDQWEDWTDGQHAVA